MVLSVYRFVACRFYDLPVALYFSADPNGGDSDPHSSLCCLCEFLLFVEGLRGTSLKMGSG